MSTADIAGGPADRWAALIATGGGLGRLRPAPGTWGTAGAAAAAVAATLATGGWPTWWFLAGAAAATAAAAWAVPRMVRASGLADPPQVVVDEIAGTWLALALVPASAAAAQPILAIGLAALWFRLLDIRKPWPVDRLEGLPSWVGVMSDDLAAGAMAGLATAALIG